MRNPGKDNEMTFGQNSGRTNAQDGVTVNFPFMRKVTASA
jgi:hypothetical protein